MPISRRRRAQLSQARKVRQEIRKKRKLDNTEVADISADDNPRENKASPGWHRPQSSEKLYSDLGQDSSSETKEDTELVGDRESTKSESQIAFTKPAVLKWDDNGKAKLRGAWGKGSRTMEERKRKNAREFQQQAAQCFHIGGMFKRAQEKAARSMEAQFALRGSTEASVHKSNKQDSQENTDVVENNTLPPACAFLVSQEQAQIDLCAQANFRSVMGKFGT